MTDEELLSTPLRNLTREQVSRAHSAKAKKTRAIRVSNKKHGPVNAGIGFVQKEKWDAYQSPIDGKVINNAQDRDRDMKENDCVDAREMLAYGQENYCDGDKFKGRV